jgi:hypothetical protein
MPSLKSLKRSLRRAVRASRDGQIVARDVHLAAAEAMAGLLEAWGSIDVWDHADLARVVRLFLDLRPPAPVAERLEVLVSLALRDMSLVEGIAESGTINHRAAEELVCFGLRALAISSEDRAYLEGVAHPDPSRHLVAILRRHRPFDLEGARAGVQRQVELIGRDLGDPELGSLAKEGLDHLRGSNGWERPLGALPLARCPGCGTPVHDLWWLPFTAPPLAWAFDAGKAGWVVGCATCGIELGEVVVVTS